MVTGKLLNFRNWKLSKFLIRLPRSVFIRFHEKLRTFISGACGHIREGEDDCEIDMSIIKSFKTGRKDCQPSAGLKRDFYTTREESHPNLHGNGPSTVDYYKNNFGLTARESIALTEGAHSFGKLNKNVSMNAYSWTRFQTNLLNNQMFRELRQEPQYQPRCIKGKFHLIGK